MSSWGSWGLHTAAEDQYSLPAMWDDYVDWDGGDHDDARSSVQLWGNVEEYLAERHGLRTSAENGQDWQEYLDHYYSHPAALAAAKLHSLAQARPQVDGYENTDDYLLNDDDLTHGAALGLLKIRRDQKTKRLEPVDPEEAWRYPVGDEAHWIGKSSTRAAIDRDVAEDLMRLAMAWDQWAPHIDGGCDGGCAPGDMTMGEYSIAHPDGSGPQVGDLLPGIKGRSLLQFNHDTDQHGNPEIYVSGIHVDENHRRDGIAEALLRRLRQDHPDTPINPGFTTDDGQGLLDGLKKRIPEAGDALVSRFGAIVRRDGEDDVVDCPSCRTESLTDDYGHGGHCPVCGQFNWEYDEHRHGSLRTAGLHGDLPENITFQHHPAGFDPFPDVIQPNVPVSSSYPTVSAHDGDKMIGHIQWRDDGHPRRDNEIWDLRVHPDYQRRGVGTALFDWTTDKINPDLKHSDNLSDEGRAFAEAENRRPLADERYEAWRNGQPMPKRFAAFDPDALHEQARTELGHLNNYLRDGVHSGVDMTTDSIEFHPHAHRIEMTPHWAGEAVAMNTSGNFGKRARARAGQYEYVLNRMVSKGPLDTQGGHLPPAHEHLGYARNNFRVELQHGNHFTVPDLSALSRLSDPSEASVVDVVNPRYHHGTGGRSPEARDAYKINCQRCVLALDARHKGYNVEARANFRDVGNPYADDQLRDNHIADWWKDKNGMPGAWIDVEDLPDPSKRPDDGSDIADPKRRERYLRENADYLHPKLADNPGPHHWDHMADIMASWGPGARGVIATTRERPGGFMRHIIHARVGPGGKIDYDDPQDPTGFADHGAHWREHTAYGTKIYSKAERDEGDSMYDSPVARIRYRNMKHSPLRFMRVDDKALTSEATKYLVDRGTAGPERITPPQNV